MNSPAAGAFRRSLRALFALRGSTGSPGGGGRSRSVVLPESGYSAGIAWPLGRRLAAPRGIPRSPGGRHHLVGDGGVESGLVDDIPRYHASHLRPVDTFLRRLGDISLKELSSLNHIATVRSAEAYRSGADYIIDFRAVNSRDNYHLANRR